MKEHSDKMSSQSEQCGGKRGSGRLVATVVRAYYTGQFGKRVSEGERKRERGKEVRTHVRQRERESVRMVFEAGNEGS